MEPSKEAASAGPVMTMENGGQVLDTIDRLKAKEKNGALTKDEQIELHHNENILARTQATNLEAKQKALSKLPTPRELHSTELAALAKAKAMLARPWPGTAPKPDPQTATAATTQSSSGPLPPGDTSTTHGVTPPTGSSSATSSQAGTGNTTRTTATGGRTSTASSGDTPAPGSGTHTTNGVIAPPVGHGNRIPEDTTHPEHIDLAKKRVDNLGKIAAKRKLNPHEQDIYDNALRVRDRNTPAQPGDRNSPLPSGGRNTPNPQDLVMAGGHPASQTQGAAAETPPAQPANAVGTTIQSPGTTSPEAPTASAGGTTPPPSAGPGAAPQNAGTSAPATNQSSGRPSSTTSSANVPPATSGSGAGGASSNAGSSPSPSTPLPASPTQLASTPPDKPVISSTSSTANPVQAKRRLAEEGYPPQAVEKYVNDNYDASKYKDLGGPDTVWLVMPSTSGQNTIPSVFAERLATDHGGTVITDGFSMDQTGQAKNKRGYMAKMDALPQVDIHDPALLAKLAGKKVVIVDDIMTSGVTSDALTEALAAKGIQTKATAVLAAVKDGAPAHPSQLKELAQTIAESTGRPLKEVLAQVKLAHGGSRGKLVVEALREAREHPNEVYERITRKAETLRTPSRGGK